MKSGDLYKYRGPLASLTHRRLLIKPQNLFLLLCKCMYNSLCIDIHTTIQTHRNELNSPSWLSELIMSIRFKFRSAVGFDAVDIGERPAISVGELKSKIIAQKNLNLCQGFDLVFSDHLTGQGMHLYMCICLRFACVLLWFCCVLC